MTAELKDSRACGAEVNVSAKALSFVETEVEFGRKKYTFFLTTATSVEFLRAQIDESNRLNEACKCKLHGFVFAFMPEEAEDFERAVESGHAHLVVADFLDRTQ
jgi:hypothetical protein